MKIRPLPPLLRGWGMVASVDIVLKGIGFLLIPVYAKYMLPAEFGVFSYAGIISGVACLVFGFGQYAIFTRSEAEAEIQQEQVIHGVLANVAFGMIVWWGVLSLIGLFFRSAIFSGKVSIYVWIFLAVQPVIALFTQLLSIDLFLTRRYFLGAMRALTECILTHGFGVAAVILFSQRTSDYRLMSCSLSAIIVMALFLPMTRFWKNIKYLLKHPLSIRVNREGLWEGLPLSMNGLIGLASGNGDRYLLEKMASKQELGFFSFAGNLSNVVIVAFSSFNNIWLGIFYQREKTNAWRIKKTILVGLGWVGIAGLSILFFEIIFIFMKGWLDKYQHARNLIPFLGVAVGFQVLGQLVGNFFNLWKKNKYTTPINFLSGIVSISVGMYLIPKWGAVGAAIQAVLTSAISFLMILATSIWVSSKIRNSANDV